MSQAGVWLADSHCCSSCCVCHFSIFIDVHEGRLGVSGLIIVFVSDYMLKNSARIEIVCFACDYK